MEKLAASQNPPGGLKASEVPQFISFGFDDNGYTGLVPPNDNSGIEWALKAFGSRTNPGGNNNRATYDNKSCSATFYFSSDYAVGEKLKLDPPELVKQAWNKAYKLGFEVGDHTHSHPNGTNFSVENWLEEIDKCLEILTKEAPLNPTADQEYNPETGAGFKREDIFGFRAPFLAYNPNLLKALKQRGFLYDASIQEGFQKGITGDRLFWPYSFDEGCHVDENVEKIPGLWELPCYAVTVPTDDLCEKYGTRPGLRKKCYDLFKNGEGDPFDMDEGKIIGLDWNLGAVFFMTKDEFLATLKYSLDLRLRGNRSPMIFGAHCDFYCPGFTFPKNMEAHERREVIEEFLDYALSYPQVRVVSMKEVVDWLKNPCSL